jgi:hypothetical protein
MLTRTSKLIAVVSRHSLLLHDFGLHLHTLWNITLIFDTFPRSLLGNIGVNVVS